MYLHVLSVYGLLIVEVLLQIWLQVVAVLYSCAIILPHLVEIVIVSKA